MKFTPKVKHDKLEERKNRFNFWLPTVKSGGYYCMGCKELISKVITMDDIPCTTKCRSSLNFGEIPSILIFILIIIIVPLGTKLVKNDIVKLIKRNPYGCLFGGEQWGSCSILLGPNYENNNIEYVFDTMNPRIYLSGVGGRILDSNGKMIQKYNQVDWQNRGLLVK
jgi:hypothetical protein